jgi:hypothetical protein
MESYRPSLMENASSDSVAHLPVSEHLPTKQLCGVVARTSAAYKVHFSVLRPVAFTEIFIIS